MKSTKDIEVRRLTMELVSMQARIAYMEEQTANSVPLEKYQACVAEKESLEAIFKFMQRVKDAGSEYGTLAQRAANYLLDDKAGFSAFLENGLIEISNNAIERCFRRLALGRRNWLQCGSHKAAEHTAFMYSLVESCEMNDIDFGDYIEYVLREINNGNEDYRSLLPNRVALPQREDETAVA